MLQHIHLALQVILVFKHGIMHRRADKDEDERRDHIAGHAQQGLQLSGIGMIALIHPGKECLAALDVFGMGIYLIHQPVFFAMMLCSPVGHLVNEFGNILYPGGRKLHEIVLHLLHTVRGGFHNQIVECIEVGIQAGFRQAAGIGQRLNACSGQAVFRIAVETGLHDLSLLPLKCLFVASFHGYPHFIALTDCSVNIG